MNVPRTDNKTGPALAAQRFQMLQDIAKELAGDVIFPTCFDVAMRLREALNAPDLSIVQICKVIAGDPLVSTKLLGLANSVAYSTHGTEIRDLKTAVQRLGLNAVRTAAMSVVMKQMLLSKELAEFKDFTTRLWNHSIMTASACQVLARQTRFNEDDALLAGLVHDIGAFYMLYRASRYDELKARPDTLRYVVTEWHESIGESLLHALGLPEPITLAVRDHDQPRPTRSQLASLGDIIYVGNILAGGVKQCFFLEAQHDEHQQILNDAYLALQPEIQEHAEGMRSIFS